MLERTEIQATVGKQVESLFLSFQPGTDPPPCGIHVCYPDDDDHDLDVILVADHQRITARVDPDGDLIWVFNSLDRDSVQGAGMESLTAFLPLFMGYQDLP